MKAINWQFVLRWAVRLIGGIALIVFLAWFISDPSLEAGAAFLSALIVFLGSFIGEGGTKDRPRDEKLDQRNRRVILQHVESFWVKGVLENSLQNVARIALDLDDASEAVARPWDVAYATPDQKLHTLTSDGQVTDIFNRVGNGRSLLVLGAPGCGKTTLLLEFTREAVARAKGDPTEPIPIVLNLSSWASKVQPLADWLVEELNALYRVPKKVSRAWIDNDALFLLLDGLDEVAGERRGACIVAINAFREDHMIPLAVCSRSEEYEELDRKLALEGAIFIQPLARERIEQYLDTAGDQLATVRDALQSDETLWELLETPLMLSVMALAYQGAPVGAIPSGSIAERRRYLFDAYIGRMFTHCRAATPFSPEQTRHWLAWLASQMQRHDQTVFLIERLQPSWLESNEQRRRYKNRARLIGGLIFGLNGMSTASQDNIKTVEALSWSWELARNGLIVGLIGGLSGGLSGGLIGGLLSGLNAGLSDGLIFGLSVGLIGGLIFGLSVGLSGGLSGHQVSTTTAPNQGIRQSTRNAVVVGLIVGLIGGLIGGLIVGLSAGLSAGLEYGGAAVILHFTLRRILVKNGHLPQKLVDFLDHSADLIFLRRVGGGWIFIHRLLMEHFADMWGDGAPTGGDDT